MNSHFLMRSTELERVMGKTANPKLFKLGEINFVNAQFAKYVAQVIYLKCPTKSF